MASIVKLAVGDCESTITKRSASLIDGSSIGAEIAGVSNDTSDDVDVGNVCHNSTLMLESVLSSSKAWFLVMGIGSLANE